MKRLWLSVVVGVLGLVGCEGGSGGANEPPTITVGYQGIVNPWKARLRAGDYEEATGVTIEWRKFNSGAEVITAMASGDVQLAVAGSSPIATALSQGLDLKLVWIVEAIDTAEALVARADTGVTDVPGLVGKRVGVPFASTTHYHLLYALERAEVDPGDVSILNLQPDAIAASWEQERIDAAFVWSPVLDRLRENGETLVTSGELAAAGRPTFDGLIAQAAFVQDHPEVVEAFVGVMARADAAYRDDTAAWTPESEPVVALSDLVGAPAAQVPGILAQYRFPTPAEQASETWLGGDAARALADTAAFLEAQGKVPAALDDYAPFLEPRFAEAAAERLTQAAAE